MRKEFSDTNCLNCSNNFVAYCNVGLELHNGLLPTVCVSSVRLAVRHANTISILDRRDDSPAIVARQLVSEIYHLMVE